MTPKREGRPGLGRAFLVIGGRAAAVATAVALVLGACSTGPGSSSTSPSTTLGASGASSSAHSAAAATLQAALASLTAASEFTSSVTVDGAVVTAVTGRSVGNATMLSVTTADRTVEYVRVPPTAWARESGGTWVVVDASQAPDSPIAALAAPLSVALKQSDTTTTLTATYPAAALGLTGDPASVTITISGSTVTFEYRETQEGRTVVSTTTLKPATDSSPILAPAT